MEKILKIAFVAGTLKCGGSERQLYYTLKVLCKRRVCVKVLSFDKDQYWQERIQKLGISVEWVGKFSHPLLWLALFYATQC